MQFSPVLGLQAQDMNHKRWPVVQVAVLFSVPLIVKEDLLRKQEETESVHLKPPTRLDAYQEEWTLLQKTLSKTGTQKEDNQQK
jgi:hypothetical protein